MKVLVTGAGGQVGRAVIDTAPDGVTIASTVHADLDIADADSVAAILDSQAPDVLINCAAYTNVDGAEQARDLAFAANSVGPDVIARETAGRGIRLIHISTDFVFDGLSSRAYRPDDETNPVSCYGESKASGEQCVRANDADALIIRTSWVYSGQSSNFLTTMLRLMRERDEIRVVCDQIGTPTSAVSLARALWLAIGKPNLKGVYHWTDSGVASWYDFAVEIERCGREAMLLNSPTRIIPIPSDQYPTPAKRPRFSVLDKTATWVDFDYIPAHWARDVAATMQEIARNA
jgi:dTDP-4-dehydrorhamnose reductase